jgi:hypothetical protein
MNQHTDEQPKPCPECGKLLEEGKALSISSMSTGAAYLCHTCKMIYTRALQPLARMVG